MVRLINHLVENNMAGKIILEVVTPERLLLTQEVDEVSAPGADGDFGVLPGHCHFMSTLRAGELRYRVGEANHYMSVLWGFVEASPSKVTVLAEVAEKAEDIDIERAEAAVAKAERRLEVGGLPSEAEAARVSLEKARLRRKVAEHARRERALHKGHS